MKRSFLSFVLLLPLLLSAQTWFKDLDVWHYQTTGFIAFSGYERIQFDRDTTVAGQATKIIRMEQEYINQLDTNLNRVQNNREVIVREHGDTLSLWLEGSFYPLYNFSLEVGDTMLFPTLEVGEVLCASFPPLRIEILEIGEMEIEGKMLRFQKWEIAGPFLSPGTEMLVVEGVGQMAIDYPNWDAEIPGGESYIFYPLNGNLRCATDMPMYDLRCFSNETLTYKLGDVPCDFIVLDTDDETIVRDIQISPNPAHQLINIHLSKTEKWQSATLYTLEGKAVKEFSGLETNDLNIGELPPGMYIIRLKLARQGLAFAKFLKL